MRRARGACTCVLLALCAVAREATAQGAPGPAASDPPAQGRPDIRPERVAVEVAGGTYVGLAGYFVGRGVGTFATRMMSEEHDHLREKIVHNTGLVAGAFTVGGFVYAVGDMGSESGSFTSTMIGVGVGAVASELLSRAVFHRRHYTEFRDSTKRKWWLATLEASLPAIGGTIGFNSSRRWQR
ncbi:MAG: hypothetical protein ACYC3L_05785 [Gemmatimonadaceae bacterium]